VSNERPAELAKVLSTTGSTRADMFVQVKEPSLVKKPEPMARIVGTARKSTT